MNEERIKQVVEAALFAAGRPLTLDQLLGVFGEPSEQPSRDQLRAAVKVLESELSGRAVQLKSVASGWRVQVRQDYAEWVGRLWEERPTRYSRALLETMALIAYRQPITRGEIEDVRGVTVSTSIMKTLLDRQWVRIVGHRDVPGRPALYGTTREFLDYFGLQSLDELPTLAELRDLDSLNVELDLGDPDATAPHGTQAAEEPATLADDEAEVVVNE
jgi:segregation and condensation protein B